MTGPRALPLGRRLAALAGVGTLIGWLASSPAVYAADGDDESNHYRIEPVAIPKDINLEVGGLDFDDQGLLYICTRRGEIWRYDSKHPSGPHAWTLFAQGLHEPLGLLALAHGDLAVVQRPELTRVRDTDGDGHADRYETMTAAWGVSGNYHEFAFGPVRDRDGNLYGTLNVGWRQHGRSDVPYRGWAWKLTPAGEWSPFAVGFRSPAGLGISPENELFVTDNQGDWMPTSPLFHVTQGGFYGHPAGLRWEKGYHGPEDAWELPAAELDARRTLPAAWFIYGPAGHSPTQPLWDTTGGHFGPFAGQILVGDQTKSIISRVMLEKVDGEYQGAVVRFRRGFASGITRMAFGPDGALWTGGTDRGWGATGGKPYALERVVFTGQTPFEVERMSLTKTGFELHFTKAVNAAVAADPATWVFQHYTFRYWSTYGSPHVGTTGVAVTQARVSADGRTVTLVLPAILARRVYELHVHNLTDVTSTPLLHGTVYYNVNRLVP